ncbi:signal peptidase II [Candidatus Peregrinibacteria bacterium]|nr:signal peptidase II [Candidatus Peregrinibacteria bacterium]
MVKLKLQPYWLLIGSAIAWFGIDWGTKLWASAADLGKVVIWDNMLYLTLHHNQGIAFGIRFGYWPQIVISFIVLSLLVYMAFLQWEGETRNAFLKQALFGIIVGGALGNLSDRIRLGYVVDFIYLKPFPVFNLADMGITLGLLTLIVLNFKQGDK